MLEFAVFDQSSANISLPDLRKKNKTLFGANLWLLRDWFIFRTSFHLPGIQGSSLREMVRFYFSALCSGFTIAFNTSLNIAPT